MFFDKVHSAGYYLVYLAKARSAFRVHSPFVYKLYTDVIRSSKNETSFRKIEEQRKKLLRQRSLLETTDFGAGARGESYRTRFRTVRNITKYSSVRPKTGRLLHRLVEFASPENILEIGTAMGISSMYMASAVPGSHFVSMEGCAVTAEKARENFNKLDLKNIDVKLGNFTTLLPTTLQEFAHLDFVFLDGNHQKEATLDYFSQLLQFLNENSIVVIDDIHWSRGMGKAWKKIYSHPDVSTSIDLFRCGILLFRKDIGKEHFILRY